MVRFGENTSDDGEIVLTYEEARQRAWKAAEELEELMGEYTDEPYIRNEARVASFASDCLSLLSDHVMISSPCDRDR